MTHGPHASSHHTCSANITIIQTSITPLGSRSEFHYENHRKITHHPAFPNITEFSLNKHTFISYSRKRDMNLNLQYIHNTNLTLPDIYIGILQYAPVELHGLVTVFEIYDITGLSTFKNIMVYN
jgi:hypothetical protein